MKGDILQGKVISNHRTPGIQRKGKEPDIGRGEDTCIAALAHSFLHPFHGDGRGFAHLQTCGEKNLKAQTGGDITDFFHYSRGSDT